MALHDTFCPLALEGKKCHEACGCMGGTPIPTVTSPPSIVSKRGVKNDSGVENSSNSSTGGGVASVAKSPPPLTNGLAMVVYGYPRKCSTGDITQTAGQN